MAVARSALPFESAHGALTASYFVDYINFRNTLGREYGLTGSRPKFAGSAHYSVGFTLHIFFLLIANYQNGSFKHIILPKW